MENQDIRWKQRFSNFEKAYVLLSDAICEKEISDFSQLEQEGLIQRFEYTWELSWKTVKDFLEWSDFPIPEPAGSRNVIKAAAQSFFEKSDINGDVFMKMLQTRNELSHVYDVKKAIKALEEIKKEYIPELKKLYSFLKKQASAA
jgi:nucleotidyltransferase substrate binding protein (TIGR01987 family)